jgi:hypothetical protein
MLRALQVLQADADASRRWQWSFDDAHELWTAGGAIAVDKAPNIQRARASEIRTTLANRGLVKLEMNTIRLVLRS